jgi:autotransporter-associated beta strand protein
VSGATAKTYSLGVAQTVGALSFPTSGNEPTVTIGNGNDVALGNTFTPMAGVLRGDNMGNWQSIAADVVLTTNTHWEVRPGYNSGLAVSGVLSGSGVSLEKWGNGTLSFKGTNTYSGNLMVQTGTVNIDFNSATSVRTNIWNPTAPVIMNGGLLNLITYKNYVSSGGVRNQQLNDLTINRGAARFSVECSWQGSRMLAELGAIGRKTGATLTLTQPSGNTTISADNGYATTNGNNVTGILGAYLTVGTQGTTEAADWAMNNGVNIVAYDGYTDLTGDAPALAEAPAANVRVTGGSTGDIGLEAGAVTINTLAVSDSASRTLSIGSGNTLRLGAVGGILTPSTAGPLTISAGTLTAGGAADAPGEIIFQNATAITNSAAIADNGTGAVTLTKSGGGSLVLTTAPTHTGGTYLNAGRLVLPGGVNPLVTTGMLSVCGGVLDLGGGVQTNAGPLLIRGGTIQNGTFAKTDGEFEIQNGTVSAVLAGSGGLLKTTRGAITLSGANTYTGDTVVAEGQATFDGTASVKGNLIVGSPDGILPVWVSCVNKPLNQYKNWTVYPNGSLNVGTSAQFLQATLTIIGGSFTGNQPYFQSGAAVKMTGGSFGGTIYVADFPITSYPTATTAVVSANLGQNHVFSVADGQAAIDLIFSGAHGGTGKTITKAGDGVMAMTGSGRSYTGSTVVQAGTLLANNTTNSCTGNSEVSVNAGATLGGVGFIGGVTGYSHANVTVTGSTAGAVTNVAVVAPGSIDAVSGAHVIGTLTVGKLDVQTNNVTLGAHSTLKINVSANGTCDRLVVNGTLSLATESDTLELNVADAGALAPGTYTLATFQQLAGAGQVFDTVAGLPSRGRLVYTATSIAYVINPTGTVISVK